MTLTALVVAQMISPAHITNAHAGTCQPGKPERVSEIVSEMPVAATSHQAIPKLSSRVT